MGHNFRLIVFAVIAAAGAYLLPGGALADTDFLNERKLYMLTQLELENAQDMLRFYEKKFSGTTKAAIELLRRKDARRSAAGCDKNKPGSVETCRRIEADYQAGIRIIGTLREQVRSSVLTQRANVEKLREEFITAVSNYVTAVALQAAILPPERKGEVKEPTLGPPRTVRRRPPSRQPTTRRRPNADWWSDAARRLQALQPLARGRR